ncbi:Crp/Fnr family transcriptional regulator [Undibacter mobilis]|uniref:Crp/Fnr family transcriptional regulator n=1 Tax=Undibacter mobilis TaxID=2292256 RepID=A0A371B8W7_9BRAD|nr:Crp/Fnr family transcriptional regulator [Undibacter mobilis]RDV04028.1 Crp/Fnr family transcriptional regulator [Undibacter mobilis]
MILGNARPNGHITPCEQCPLRRLPCLREFTPQELEFIKRFKIDELRVEPGASFLHEGSRSEHLYTVLEGWAFRYKTLDDGRRQILNFALPADMVGLQGAVMEEMEHSVEALTPLTLCVLPRRRLYELYSQYPTLAFDITWLAAREEQMLEQHLVSIGRRSALERVAFVLLHIYGRARELGLARDNIVAFPLTQQHLADALGLSLVHTNKTLKRLIATKAIRWQGRQFELLNEEMLSSIAGTEAPASKNRPFI